MCPSNAGVSRSDFTEFTSVDLDPSPHNKKDPLWMIYGNVSCIYRQHIISYKLKRVLQSKDRRCSTFFVHSIGRVKRLTVNGLNKVVWCHYSLLYWRCGDLQMSAHVHKNVIEISSIKQR